MGDLIPAGFRRCILPCVVGTAPVTCAVHFWPILLLGVILLTACGTTSSSRQFNSSPVPEFNPPPVPAPQRVIEGAFGVHFDMGKDDLSALGFVEWQVQRGVGDVGIWSKNGIADIDSGANPSFWGWLEVCRTPKTGRILWIKGSKFYSRTTHLNAGEECRGTLQQLMGALRQRYPTLEQYPGLSSLIRGRYDIERWILTERRIRSKVEGFEFANHRDARFISLTCSRQVSGEDRNIGHLLTIHYNVSSAESEHTQDEFKAEFDSRSSDQLQRQGLNPSDL